MTFLATVAKARDTLETHGRVSLRALQRELELGDADLQAVVDELVVVQAVVRRDGDMLILTAATNAATAPRAYTPNHLADNILAGRAALQGEKKLVTVLFCDIENSMEAAVALGAEDWHAALDRFFRVATSAVHRAKGTINQYTGDGIMALFGAPIAHEDHARHACLAALALQAGVHGLRADAGDDGRQLLHTRIGLHTGEVVVGRIGDDLRMDYTAQGQVVGIAARLQALAPTDGILLSQSTAREMEGFFELSALGSKAIKGVATPLAVFGLGHALPEVTRFEVTRGRGLTRFVGRHAEMTALRAALAEARAGNGRVVGVVAEAGVGKSRLCYEFLQGCRAEGMTVLEGHAVVHGQQMPYLPMLQIFRAYYGIVPEDDDRTARSRIAERLLGLDPRFAEALPVVFEFFGVGDPAISPPRLAPEAKQRQLFSVLRQLLHGADRDSGRIIAYIEDLHWLDPGSDAFLAHWVDALTSTDGFLLVNFRPEYRADWMHNACYRPLPLAPLSAAATQAMVAALVAGRADIAALGEAIFERTAGNPFFCEEVVASLTESGALHANAPGAQLAASAAGLKIPASIQAVLAARIDRLADDDKAVLQAAAVLGRHFQASLLAQIVELSATALATALRTLVAGEFVLQQGRGANREYRFKHALTREVALASQLGDQRRRTHAAAARAIEAAHAAQPDPVAPLLAHHWEAAGEPLTAAQWLLRAGDAISSRDIVQAMRHMQGAVRLTQTLPASAARDTCRLRALTALLIRVGWRVGQTRAQVDGYFDEAQRLLRLPQDLPATTLIKAGYAVCVGLSFGDLPAWGRLMDEIAVERERLPPEARHILMGANRGYGLLMRGRLHETLAEMEAARDALAGDWTSGQAIAGFSTLGQIVGMIAFAHALQGHLQSALAELTSVRDALMEEGLFEESIWRLVHTISIYRLIGVDPGSDQASALLWQALQARAQAEKRASDFTYTAAHRAVATARMLGGDSAAAVTEWQALLALCRDRNIHRELEADMQCQLAEAQLLAGDLAAAEHNAENARKRAREQDAWVFEAKTCIALARIRTAQRGRDTDTAIGRLLDAATALVERTGARALTPQIAEARARLTALLGDTDAARAGLEAARALYLRIGADGQARRLAAQASGEPAPPRGA